MALTSITTKIIGVRDDHIQIDHVSFKWDHEVQVLEHFYNTAGLHIIKGSLFDEGGHLIYRIEGSDYITYDRRELESRYLSKDNVITFY